jgi:DEAD/DEAH box helicase domain-containing protein
MSIEIKVTNRQPDIDENVNEEMHDLFISYAGAAVKPFRHQAEAFRAIEQNRGLFLVAGTAAGKTLAVAVPLFWKLQAGLIRKVMFFYPTVALLEDQSKVMHRLAQITGLDNEVGKLQGGMSRSELIQGLNKKIILATPDEIYWFFRKNVKYNALLIYGLGQIDEFVLDEAHLFNGLMLRNFEHLWQRVRLLSRYLQKTPKLHILTATPTEALKRLNHAEEIRGRSKCEDVMTNFQTRAGWDERAQQLVTAVNEALSAGHRKILVVSNSARTAHQIFEKFKVNDTSQIPIEHRLKYGKVTLGHLINCLNTLGAPPEISAKLSERLFRDTDINLGELPVGVALEIPLEKVIASTTEILETGCWQVKHGLWKWQQEKKKAYVPLETVLPNRRLPKLIAAELKTPLESTIDLEAQRALVDGWLAARSEEVESIGEETLLCHSPEFNKIAEVLHAAGFSQELAKTLLASMKFKLSIEPDWIKSGKLPMQNLSQRPIYLRWLHQAVDDPQLAGKILEAVQQGLDKGLLEVECRHIGSWKPDPNVPVIVYSGSMAKHSREGLVDVFGGLERAVLISTSAVEVGVDFSADMLITEECEGHSFLQRFGRVGRHGSGSKVVAFISGEVYGKFSELDKQELARDDFSRQVTEAFPLRGYATASQFLDASHYLINEQLGRVGKSLNTDAHFSGAASLAAQLRQAAVSWAYGLRGTMPQIALRDGVTKDPFYLLRYVDNPDLRPPDSPFEVARAVKWFTGLIFERARFNVIVDLDATLKASQHLFLPFEKNAPIRSQTGIGRDYLKKMNDYFGKTGGWNKWHPGNALLLNGDIYLTRIDRETPHPEPVEDALQNPLFIPQQTYLVLYGWTNFDETKQLMTSAGVAEWEELHFDWDRLRQDLDVFAMVILEKNTGACFEAYNQIVRTMQKFHVP